MISEFSAYPKVMRIVSSEEILFICLAVSDLSCGMWDLSLQRAGSVVVAGRPCCHVPQGSNPRPLHWKADSQLLDHQEVPGVDF